MALLLSLAYIQTAKEENSGRIVLPSSKLLRCKSSDCFQLWQVEPEQNVVHPKQVIIDMDQDCLYGMTVLYDKAISIEDVKRAIDARYGKWAVQDSTRLWRVEPEKVAIQLGVANKKDERMHIADEGTKDVIFLAFGGKAACSAPAS